MKKVIFLVGIVGFYCISCSSSKKNMSSLSAKDYYKNNPYAQPYLNNPHLITEDEAKIYINEFKHHKYKTFGKKKLNNPWSTFDSNVLESFAKDSSEVSIIFYLAAFGKTDKNVPKGMDSSYHPFIIMEVRPMPPMSGNGKGSAESPASAAKSLFFSPRGLCPPPNTGCRIPGAD